jgi:uncharacterized protein YndB with AHSA1/START domain
MRVRGEPSGMKIYSAARSTTAAPERVWSIWSDPNNWSRWNSSVRACTIDGPFVSGAGGVMETKRGKHAVTFTGIEPPRRFSVRSAGPPLTTFTFACEIVPEGTGSKISQSVVMAGPLASVFGPMIGNQMAAHFVAILDELAAAAEAP